MSSLKCPDVRQALLEVYLGQQAPRSNLEGNSKESVCIKFSSV